MTDKKMEIEKVYSLAPTQAGMLFHALEEKESRAYFEQFLFTIRGEVDKDILQESLNRIIQRYDTLRTVFVYKKMEKLKQVVLKNVSIGIGFTDLMGKSEEERREFLERFKREDLDRGFDLTRDRLMRFSLFKTGAGAYILAWSFHHIIMDGWCSGIIFNDLTTIYGALRDGTEPELGPVTPYKAYIDWLDTRDREEGFAYWREVLEDYSQPAGLPVLKDTAGEAPYRLERYNFVLENPLSSGLEQLARQNRMTPATLFQALWGVFLGRYNHTTDVVFGAVVSGRPPEIDGIERMVGLFVNALPVRVRRTAGQGFTDLLTEVHKQGVLTKPYEYLPLAEIQAGTQLKRDLVHHIVAFENYPIEKEIRDESYLQRYGFVIDDIQAYEQTNYDFDIIVVPREEILVRFNYNASVYDSRQMEETALNFKQLVRRVLEAPDRDVETLDILHPDQRRRVLEEFNRTDADFPSDRTLHRLISNRAAAAPAAEAVRCGDDVLTYAQLEEASNRLGHYLHREKGVAPGRPVGILMERNIHLMTAVLGTLKAGGAYVPLDPALPEERNKSMINDAAIGTVLSLGRYIRTLDRLLWECPPMHTFLCLDSRDIGVEEEREKSGLMDQNLWHHVGREAGDDITGGGWQSSYTGEPLSPREMEEYGGNVLQKLEPLLRPGMRVLEIGCASGLTMYRIAPKVGFYLGTDLSEVIIEKNRRRISREGLDHVTVAPVPAHEIDTLGETGFDLVIVNSVIHCFHGHNYLLKVIGKILDLAAPGAFIFLGDVLDHTLKDALVKDMKAFKRDNREDGLRTKTDWSAECFVAPGFFRDLTITEPRLAEVEITKKIHTLENELTRYRYDALFRVDKNAPAGETSAQRPRLCKYREDARVLEGVPGTFPGVETGPADPAYIIFTSGSTGKPKGAVIRHDSAVNRLHWMQRAYPIGAGDVILQKTPFIFDVSVWEIFWWALEGASVYFLAPGEEKEPAAILRAIEERGVTTMHFVPSMLGVFLEHVDVSETAAMARSLRRVFASGEALPPHMVETFNRLLFETNGTRLVNLYGPTEATVDVSYFNCSTGESFRRIPIGKPIDNIELYVLNRALQLQPVGVPGQLFIGGVGLAAGYINRPELTADSFIKPPAHLPETPLPSRLYKTGDLARQLPDGNIEFLGRIDQQVKIRGFRIELEEIENRLLQHDDISGAVVTARPDGKGDKNLCAYIVAGTKLGGPELRDYLGFYLPEYMIPSRFVPLEDLPRTPGGKVDRKALPDPEGGRDAAAAYAAPRGEVEETLARIWEEVLEVDRVGANDDFFRLGGNSIRVIRIISEIQRQFNAEVRLNDFIQLGTVARIARRVAESKAESAGPVYPRVTPNPDDIHLPFPLTDVQMAYLMGRGDRFEMGNISTHAYKDVRVGLDIPRLNRALNLLIQRHPMMRAIVLEDGTQKILEPREYRIEVEDLTALAPAAQKERVLRERARMSHDVFETEQWPLFEIKAFKLSASTHHLCIGMDILIADAAGIGILSGELMRFYENPELELPPLEFTFRDYVMAYQDFKGSELYRKDKEYWHQLLPEFPAAPALPLRCEPAAVEKPHFKRLGKVFSRPEWEKLKAIAQRRGVTASALLCTAYAEVLAYWSNQPRLAVNLTVFNRYPFHPRVDDIVGDFTSVILLGLDLSGGASFWDKASTVQRTLWDALEHRHYDGISFIRDIARKTGSVTRAVMPVVFTSTLIGGVEEAFGVHIEDDGPEDPGADADELKGTSITQTSQVFLDHQVGEEQGELTILWDYVDEIFDPETIALMFRQYISIVARVIETGEGEAPRYSLELPPAQQELLDAYNGTAEPIPPGTLHGLFARQAEAVPNRTAVEEGDRHISYERLDRLSNRVARYLKEQGVRRGDRVGVLAHRVIETMVNILGVLKCGAAYVPVEPEYPEDRRDYIYQNSDCRMMLTPDTCTGPRPDGFPDGAVENIDSPGDLAYIIYTSGSTGRPKGVCIEHGAVTNTVIDIDRKFEVGPDDRIIGISSLCFDLSVYDIFGSFSTGAALVMIPDQRDVNLLADTLAGKGITVWNSVPAVLDMVVKHLEQEENRGAAPGGEVYHWAPGVSWSQRGHRIKIGHDYFSGVALEVFPRFYFLCGEGSTEAQLISQFPAVEPDRLKELIRRLVQKKILLSDILSMDAILKPQEKLFKNVHGEEILYDAGKYEAFKQQQLKRSLPAASGPGIPLRQESEFPAFISGRRTYREFDVDRLMDFETFSMLLSVFKQYADPDTGTVRYYYASGGALYPVDLYAYVKENRVGGLEAGLYYYCPVTNRLHLTAPGGVVTEEVHSPGNRPIFATSAFSLFMIYDAGVSMPKYGGLGFQFAAVDTGLMVGVLTQAAELLGVGLCSIGSMNFERIRGHFRLRGSQVFMHAVELGLVPGKEVRPAAASFPQDLPLLEPVPAAAPGHGTGGAAAIRGLRLVMLSGDWIPLPLPDKIKRHFPNARSISLGGATEASIWSIYYPIQEVREEWKSIPYGRPLANQSFYVLNYALQPCPVGVAGELYIGGAGLASGYMKDPDKTRVHFIRHPRLGNLYRTGDFGVMHGEGYIEFLGRRDQQVKIRGYRIELGEIETQLLKHPGVGETAVTVRTGTDGERNLCAYVTPAASGPAPAPGAAALREHLAKLVPTYMVPAYFVPLPELPLTANNKVDRKSLPDPEEVLERPKTAFAAPETEVEKQVTEACRTVTGLERLGVEDNFFDLGINSVDIARINRQLREAFKVEIPIASMFEFSTIRSFARYLSRELLPGAGAAAEPPSPQPPPSPPPGAQGRLQLLQRRKGVKHD